MEDRLTVSPAEPTRPIKNLPSVGRHCLDGYEAQGSAWFTPGPKKATARSLCICPTTQPLHQGAGDAGKPKPEASLATEIVERKVAGSNPDRDKEDFSEPFLF